MIKQTKRPIASLHVASGTPQHGADTESKPARQRGVLAALRRGAAAGAKVGWGKAEMPAERAIEIRKIGEACLGGDIGDLARGRLRIAQQRRRFFKAPLQHMMREALAGLFEQKMHVTRRDAEPSCHRDDIEMRIGAANFDFAQDGSPPCGAQAVHFRGFARLAFGAEGKTDQVDDMLIVKRSDGPGAAPIDVLRRADIVEQQAAGDCVAIKLRAAEAGCGSPRCVW